MLFDAISALFWTIYNLFETFFITQNVIKLRHVSYCYVYKWLKREINSRVSGAGLTSLAGRTLSPGGGGGGHFHIEGDGEVPLDRVWFCGHQYWHRVYCGPLAVINIGTGYLNRPNWLLAGYSVYHRVASHAGFPAHNVYDRPAIWAPATVQYCDRVCIWTFLVRYIVTGFRPPAWKQYPPPPPPPREFENHWSRPIYHYVCLFMCIYGFNSLYKQN